MKVFVKPVKMSFSTLTMFKDSKLFSFVLNGVFRSNCCWMNDILISVQGVQMRTCVTSITVLFSFYDLRKHKQFKCIMINYAGNCLKKEKLYREIEYRFDVCKALN